MPRLSRWRRVASKPMDALADKLGGAMAGDRDALHAARVASRRVRALVAIVRPGLRRRRHRKLVRRLRRITSALGRVRELDVSLALLDDARPEDGQAAARVAAVKSALSAERDEALATAARKASQEVGFRIREVLSATLAALEEDKWDFNGAVSDELERRGRRLLDAVNRARVFYDADRLHRARVALKGFRYAVELASAARARPAKRQLAVLRQAQDLLGQVHDLDVLIQRLRAAGESDGGKIAGKLEAEARTVHAEYVSLRPRLTAVITECLQGQASRAVTRRAPSRGSRLDPSRRGSARRQSGHPA